MLAAVVYVERIVPERGDGREPPLDGSETGAISTGPDEIQEWLDTFDAFVGKCDQDGMVVFMNEPPLVAGGLTREEVLGRYFPDTEWWSHSAAARARIDECIGKAKRGLSSRIETSFRDADGTPVPLIFSSQPVTDVNGNVKFITVEGKTIVEEMRLREALQEEKESLETRVEERTAELVRANEALRDEIAERKRVEKALQASEEKFRSLSEHALDIITIIDADGRLQYASPSAERVLGYTSEELIGQAAFDFTHPEEQEELGQTLAELFADPGAHYSLVHRFRHKDGSWRILESVGSAHVSPQGELQGVAHSRDITERHALEAQLRQAQKMEAVGQLTTGVAHDFNNLLSVILANTQLIAELAEREREELGASLTDVESAAKSGAAMVKKLLGYGRGADLAMTSTNLCQVARDLAPMLSRVIPENIRIELACDVETRPVRADTGAVEQIILNLVTNARDAMPEGGTLRIEVTDAPFDDAHAAPYPWVAPGDCVVVAVSDTGTGMDAATLQKIFEPFFTTKPPGVGTGLGMAMVYGLMKQHGGFAHVESEVGKGTSVSLCFPALRKHHAVEISTKPTQPVGLPSGSETILLVEDQDSLRGTACRILKKFGYSVIEATNGVEALEQYRTRRAEIDLVITDLIMPEMGGHELLRTIRADGDTVPFLVTTGYTEPEVEGGADLNPDVPLMHKPWTLEELLGTVREVLDAGRASSPS